jgi:putative hemolysin
MTRPVLLFVATVSVALLTLGMASVRAVNRLWLRSLMEKSAPPDRWEAQDILRDPTRLLLAAGSVLAFVGFLSGALLALIDRRDAADFARDALLLMALLSVLGIVVPHVVARRWPKVLVRVLVPMMRAMTLAVAPLCRVAEAIGSGTRRIARGAEATGAQGLDTAQEFESFLKDGAPQGLDVQEEMAIISGVARLSGKRVGQVMTPRSGIFALEESLPADERARRVAAAAFSRVPVFRGTLDHPVGMLHAFDVLLHTDDSPPRLRAVTEAPASKPAAELLFELLRSRRQLALVRDDAHPDAPVAGLVTLEDLLEEVVGEIADEHDEPEVNPS